MPRVWLALLFWTAAAVVTANQPAPEMELIKAHRLVWPGNFQPSGLAWCRDRLLTVSDRHDLEVLEIELTANDKATVRRYLTLDRIPDPPALRSTVDVLRQMILTVFHKQYDWEGITCDDQGTLYLASESFSALLKLPLDGKPSWITLGEHPTIQHRQMLVRHNSGIEGVQWIDRQDFMIAAEQSPAGLIRCRLLNDQCDPSRAVVVSDQNLRIDIRTWDISGLSIAENNLYLLERYYSRICRRDWHHFRIEECRSFKATEKAPEYAHKGANWGQAEGLLIKGDRIYVAIDNNGRSLASAPDSTDTWLFELKRPQGF